MKPQFVGIKFECKECGIEIIVSGRTSGNASEADRMMYEHKIHVHKTSILDKLLFSK
jgi:hypothetical protein